MCVSSCIVGQTEVFSVSNLAVDLWKPKYHLETISARPHSAWAGDDGLDDGASAAYDASGRPNPHQLLLTPNPAPPLSSWPLPLPASQY